MFKKKKTWEIILDECIMAAICVGGYLLWWKTRPPESEAAIRYGEYLKKEGKRQTAGMLFSRDRFDKP